MEETQKPGETAPFMEGLLQEHTIPHRSEQKGEQVKIATMEANTDSPQLLAQIPLPNAGTKLDHEPENGTNIGLNMAQDNGVAIMPPINGAQPSLQSYGLREWEEESIDMDRVTLPLLSSFDDLSAPGAGTSITGSESQVKAYAMLQFDDGPLYMNTFAVELGRDVKAARDALQQGFEDLQDQDQTPMGNIRSKSRTNSGRSPSRKEYRKVARSVISESGGILNYNPDGITKPSKTKHRRAKSGGSVSRLTSRSNSLMDLALDTISVNPSDLMYSQNPDVVQNISSQSDLPSPQECPLIPIHPPVAEDGSSAGHKGISRRHVKIEYNFSKKCFEMTVKGLNGAFVDEIHYQRDEVVELTSGCYIQIGGVNFRFILPNVPEWETGSGISYDFEHNRGEKLPIISGSSSASSVIEELDSPIQQTRLLDSDSDSEDDESEEELEQVLPRKSTSGKKLPQKGKKAGKTKPSRPPKIKLSLKTGSKEKREAAPKSPRATKSPSVEIDEEALKAKAAELNLSPDMIRRRRKGPGRPPKNGFMSKREEASLKKQAREAARAQAVADGILPPEALLEPIDSSGKRKSNKKENDKEIHESIEGDDGVSLQSKFSKEKKALKPPKSPSPFVDRNTLTAEQLAKPQHSYLVMIHEALSGCPDGKMSLPQIYKAIERKYPYFKYTVTTPGWQSSIRHNLSQHEAFQKTETREGKGWMWCLNPEVSIEKEKRPRRSTPPQMAQQPYAQGGYFHKSTIPHQGMPPLSVNGITPVNFSHAVSGPGFMAPASVQASDGPSTAVSNPLGTSNLYHSPYGSHNGKAIPSLAAGSPSNSAATGATPYLRAQMTHHSIQGPTLPVSITQNGPLQFNVGPGLPPLSAQAMNAINKYKSTLMGLLELPNREVLINTVIDKVLGRPVTEFASDNDRTAAAAIEKPLVGLLQRVREGELAAERQRQAQTQATASQGHGNSTTGENAASAVSGPVPTSNNIPSAVPKAAQPELQGLPPAVGNTTQSNISPTSGVPVELKKSEDTIISSNEDKPETSAITLTTAQQASAPQEFKPSDSNPKATANTNIDASESETSPPSTVKQEDNQKQFLSILSQLGPSGATAAMNTNGVNGARNLKRALDEEPKDASAINSSMEQPRAAKRVAV